MNKGIELNENLIAVCGHSCEVKNGSNNYRFLINFYQKNDKDRKPLPFGINNSLSELPVYIDKSEFEQKNITASIENAEKIVLDFIKTYFDSTGKVVERSLYNVDFKSVVLKNGLFYKNKSL